MQLLFSKNISLANLNIDKIKENLILLLQNSLVLASGKIEHSTKCVNVISYWHDYRFCQ